jgi:hypothetical protein
MTVPALLAIMAQVVVLTWFSATTSQTPATTVAEHEKHTSNRSTT